MFFTYINCFCYKFFDYVSFWNLFLYHDFMLLYHISVLWYCITRHASLCHARKSQMFFFCDIRNVMSITVKWHQIKNINCKNQNVMEHSERQCIYSTGTNWIIWMQTKIIFFQITFTKCSSYASKLLIWSATSYHYGHYVPKINWLVQKWLLSIPMLSI